MQTHAPQPQGGGDWGTHNEPQDPWGQQPPGSWGAPPASEHQQQQQQQQSNAGATSNQQQQDYWGVAPQQQQPPPQIGQVPASQEMQPQPPLLGTVPGAQPVAPGPPTMFAGISFGPGQAPVPYIAPFPIQVGQQVMVEGREDQPPGVVVIIGPQIPPQGVPTLRVLPPTVDGAGPAPGAAPAPSAMPQRQESWGVPPAQASWVTPGEHQVGPVNRGLDLHKTGWFLMFQIIGWILTLIVWFLLFFYIPVCETRKTFNINCSPDLYGPPIFIVLATTYGGMVAISSIFTPVREYLQNPLPGGIEPYLEKLESATPAIRSEIVCYNETDKGERHVRHEAQYDYPYDAWWDVSEPMANTGHSGATRVHLSAEWKAADTHTEQVHGKLHAAFVTANEQQVKDADADYHCVTVKAVLPDYHREVLYFSNPQDRPICIGFVWLVLFSFLTFGMPYQAYFYARTAATHFVCTKLIRRDRRPDDPQ